MAIFTARNVSASVVPVSAERIWKHISDPASLTALTPLVRSIVVDGDLWRWQLAGIDALGVSRAGADGTYELSPHDDGTELTVDIALTIELPLPRLSAVAVERVMKTSMQRTGKRFAVNLYHRLGLDPSTIKIRQLRG